MSILGTRKRRVTAIVGAVAVVAVSGGIAFAYWTTTGTGTGTATTGTSNTFAVSSVDPVGDPLTPGGGSQSVAFTVHNQGPSNEELSNVVVTVATSNGTPWTSVPGCSAADYTVATPTTEDVLPEELADGTDENGIVTISMNDLSTEQDACQGVTVPLYFAAS